MTEHSKELQVFAVLADYSPIFPTAKSRRRKSRVAGATRRDDYPVARIGRGTIESEWICS
jgi:hypothetical protein